MAKWRRTSGIFHYSALHSTPLPLASKGQGRNCEKRGMVDLSTRIHARHEEEKSSTALSGTSREEETAES